MRRRRRRRRKRSSYSNNYHCHSTLKAFLADRQISKGSFLKIHKLFTLVKLLYCNCDCPLKP